jgi:hypothetical protein
MRLAEMSPAYQGSHSLLGVELCGRDLSGRRAKDFVITFNLMNAKGSEK